MKGYIYIIKNTKNNKVYVGQTSRTIEDRWKQHKNAAIRGEEQGIILYNAMRKYGIENFYITQLEECELKDINDREIYWIQYYNCQTPNGYNVRSGGEDPGRKEVCKIDINTNQIIECYGSAMAAAELNNIDLSLLTKTCRHEEGHDTCGGFKWSYLDNLSKVNNNKGSIKNFKVQQLDGKTLELIKVWNNVKEAADTLGIDASGISHCLSGRYKTTAGFAWKRDDDNFDIYIPSSNKRKAVIQYDLKTGDMIKEWISASAANKELNVSASSIQKVCRGERKSAGGYYWQYKEE